MCAAAYYVKAAYSPLLRKLHTLGPKRQQVEGSVLLGVGRFSSSSRLARPAVPETALKLKIPQTTGYIHAEKGKNV